MAVRELVRWWIAGLLLVSVAACVGVGKRSDACTSAEAKVSEERIADRVYARLLSEVWQEVKPMYETLDLPVQTEPANFAELLRPFIGIGQGERGESPGALDPT
jgi:hypothetical protein